MSRYEIHNGDCLEVMKGMPSSSVDVIITSPPYNLGERPKCYGKSDRKGTKWGDSDLMSKGYEDFDDAMPYDQYKTWQREVLGECLRLLTPFGVLFYNHKPRVFKGELRTPLGWTDGLPLRQIIIWDRCGGFNANVNFYQPVHEWVMVFAKPDFRISRQCSTTGDVWRIPPEVNTHHPAPFPLELPLRALRSLDERYQTVMDPFCGRGTVCVAAHRTGRSFIGIEQSANYCEMARAWLEAEAGTFRPREFGGLFAQESTP